MRSRRLPTGSNVTHILQPEMGHTQTGATLEPRFGVVRSLPGLFWPQWSYPASAGPNCVCNTQGNDAGAYWPWHGNRIEIPWNTIIILIILIIIFPSHCCVIIALLLLLVTIVARIVTLVCIRVLTLFLQLYLYFWVYLEAKLLS